VLFDRPGLTAAAILPGKGFLMIDSDLPIYIPAVRIKGGVVDKNTRYITFDF
jgi:hypothetical protein